MKRLIFTSLSILIITATGGSTLKSVQAQETKPVSFNSTVVNSDLNNQINPFSLAHMAYWGYFKNSGIPGGNTLVSNFVSGSVQAKDIIGAAIKTNRLPQATLNNQQYIHALEEDLNTLAQQ